MWAAFDKKLTKDGFAPNHAPVFLHIFYAIEGVTHASRFGCVGALRAYRVCLLFDDTHAVVMRLVIDLHKTPEDITAT